MTRPSHRLIVAFAACLWIGVVGIGLVELWRYSLADGVPGIAPTQWPAESTISPTAGKPTLVMVAHPQCPCSRASIGELARIMAQSDVPLSAYVLFVKPEGLTDDWVESDLWWSAAAIPGVTVIRDDGGREATLFGAATSGQTMLYDADGSLAFSGGITAARGHAGDNAGESTIVSLLGQHPADRTDTPVFGCALFAANTHDDTQVCAQ